MLANVALLYYGEGLTQSDIARRMSVSRATVVNMLREARETRIVNILVEGKYLAGSSMSNELRDKFGLEDVYVANSGKSDSKVSRAEMLRHLGRVGAIALTDITEPGDTIGVAWGETIFSLSEQMPQVRKPDVTVCQMIGSMNSEIVPASEQCAIQIANMMSAKCFTLHAPGVGSSPEIAALLRTEPTIEQQLLRLRSLDVTVASIGHVGDQTHLVKANMTTLEELHAARDAGAVGVICCRYIDANGEPVRVPPDDRLIATDCEDLRLARKKLLVVGGVRRKDAVLAAIKGDYVTHLCIDQSLAAALLDS